MDMQELKYFENYLLEKHLVDVGDLIGIKFVEDENEYKIVGATWAAELEDACTELNVGWDAWQAAKASAVPDGYVLVKSVHPDAIVHNQGLSLFRECQVIYGWNGKSKDFKDALNKGFYHGVKLGAKAVLDATMIKAAQEQGQ